MGWFNIFLLVTLVYTATGAPQVGESSKKEVKIISQTNEITPGGGYEWSFEADNGIKAQETGTLKKSSSKDSSEEDGGGDVIVAKGSYSYIDPDGNTISLTYVADDEGGFQPQGAHLPTPPPIPPNIQKALDWIASQPSTTEKGKK